MFTGIVAAVGSIVSRSPLAGGFRIAVDTAGLGLDDVVLGDSIAVDGCCLTVVAAEAAVVSFDVSLESIARTAGFDLGRRVNLEKALRLSDRLGGHLVSGHVDGLGEVVVFEPVGESWRLDIRVPASIARYLAYKGSVTVNGTSLTVNSVVDQASRDCIISINLIPHTIEMTTLKHLAQGMQVNLEIDLIARYVERMLRDGDQPVHG